MSTSDNRRHLKQLQAIIDDDPYGLDAEVARVIIDRQPDDVAGTLHDLARHGCVSGMIGPMIAHADTHTFFDRHYAEIEELREDAEDALGEALCIQGDLKNALAWFAFEETAYRIGYSKLDLDL